MQKFWAVLFGVVLLAELVIWPISAWVGWWLPPLANAGSFGTSIDILFYVILYVTGVFFVLTSAILVYNMWRFTYNPERRAVYTHGSHKLEMIWTIVPAILLILLAFVQIGAWEDIKYQSRTKPPQQIMEVSGRQFEWRIRYPHPDKLNGTDSEVGMAAAKEASEWPEQARNKADFWGNNSYSDPTDLHVVNEVHTWVNANTRIYLKSRDVLHSFFLPNLRLKQDAVPGKIIPVWFKATDWNTEFKDGQLVVIPDKRWELACAELCGWGHYKMSGRLYVHKDRESYDAWLSHRLAQQNARTRTPTRQ